jgi:hypothetical protein
LTSGAWAFRGTHLPESLDAFDRLGHSAET